MSLIEAWDRQQELYIGGREARFDALLDAVDWHVERLATSEPVVVDLCCGPAAIGRRLLRRFPTARYIGVDIDPVLLELARPYLGEAQVLESQLKRWRFATPRRIWPEAHWSPPDVTGLAVAGDAFAGPRVEGAALSGLSAAASLV